MRRAVSTILVIAFLMLSCMPVYGAEKSYFQPETWINNPDIYSENISKKSNSYKLDGVFKYYFDAQNNIFYTYFSITESTLSEDRCDIRLVYTVDNVFDTYSFSIDAEGICDTSYISNDYFTVEQIFSTYRDSCSGLYISSIMINDGCTHNDISIKIYVNGHIYKIAENIPLDKMTEKKAVSQSELAESTVSSTSARDKKTSKTTTAKKKTTTKAKTTGATKFQYNSKASKYSSATSSENNTVPVGTTAVAEISQQEEHEEEKGSLTHSAKVCCIAAGVFASAGILFLLAGVFTKSAKAKKDKSDNEEQI